MDERIEWRKSNTELYNAEPTRLEQITIEKGFAEQRIERGNNIEETRVEQARIEMKSGLDQNTE